VPDEARRGDAAVGLAGQHHPDSVAAERIHVLGDGVGPRQLATVARAAPAIADDIAVEAARRGRSGAAHSSSPRAALERYGGKRYAMSRESSPPWPISARLWLFTRS